MDYRFIGFNVIVILIRQDLSLIIVWELQSLARVYGELLHGGGKGRGLQYIKTMKYLKNKFEILIFRLKFRVKIYC